MGNIHNERYDEIKSLIKKSKMLFEQEVQDNVARGVQDRIDQDMDYETSFGTNSKPKSKNPKDKVQRYRISGGIIALHAKNKSDLDITEDDKLSFQETMDEFIEEVSDLTDFYPLNIYPNNVEWSGKVIDQDIDFTFSIGEENGIYVNGNMLKIDSEFLDIINKLQQFYQKFKSKWGKILASRKKTKESPM